MFRLAAVCLGILPFAALETCCRLTSAGTEVRLDDSWSEFAGTRPLFEAAGDGTVRIAAERRAYFAHDSFPEAKPRGQKRVFVLGGSTVQGRPFSLPTAFPTFLEMTLRHSIGQTDWDVVNCGGISYASYRLRPILAECLHHDPDLIVICTGHNEFLEFITYAHVCASPASVQAINSAASQLVSIRLLRSAMIDTEQRGPLPTEIDAILDHADGLAAYHRSAIDRASVVCKFARHIRNMIHMSQQAGVPVVMLSPPSNLRDCPPFKSEFSAETTEETRDQIRALLLQAQEPSVAETTAAMTLLQNAVDLDPQYALSWYRLGLSQLQHRQYDVAATSLNKACDEDVCPLRMTSALRTEMLRVAHKEEVPLIDLQQTLSTSARMGIPGRDQLVDHIHPSFTTSQQIAVWLARELEAIGLTSLPRDLEQIVAEEFQTHVQSLDNLYFLDGRRTLQVMEAWTQGRADGPPLGSQVSSSE